jgi:Cytochrome c7 and related cytochrome c
VNHSTGDANPGAVVAKALLALCLFPALAFAQFSPGALSKAHTKLDGPTHCTSCHIGGGRDRKLKCTGCHAEIKQRLSANQGLHPSLMGQNRRDDQCGKCHSEHNGEKFVPIRWDVSLDEFDHRKAGYPLEGGHLGLKCVRCHNPERIAPAARKTILMKDLRRSYLGLGTACATCHEDKHKGQVGDKCERCHTVAKWKDVTRFDHSTAKYKLTGAHAKVDCAKCHATLPPSSASSAVIRYTGIPFAQCADCHKDPHRGSFAAGCNSCHNDSVWKPARNSFSAFDHSKTKFPLLGKHAPVTCDKCHKTSDFKAPVAHEQCKACHKDIHGGQFAARADAGDCASCHTADDWKPSTYTLASHAKSMYPLLGKHAAVACDKCHLPARAATVYKVRYEECKVCHRDPHAGQFAAATHRDRCEDCHMVDRFQPAKYTLSRHTQTRFPLEGGHVAVACGDCHQKRPELHNTEAYRFADLSCTGCHLDPHQPQVRGTDVRRVSSAKQACEVCHNVRTWHQVASFDHSKTHFALTGSHRGAVCEECHRATALSVGIRKVVFQNAPLTCVGCHEDVHAGQFAAMSEGQGCEACHDNIKWKPGKFDHQQTSFSLAGAHERVPCKDCHSTKREVNGRLVVFYKPTPKDCASCHGPKLKN